jgi:hypothetical protein
MSDIDIKEWIRDTMRLRCQAVIEATGWPDQILTLLANLHSN